MRWATGLWGKPASLRKSHRPLPDCMVKMMKVLVRIHIESDMGSSDHAASLPDDAVVVIFGMSWESFWIDAKDVVSIKLAAV